MRYRSTQTLGALALFATIAGCGSSVSYETVFGKVTLDGAPLPMAKVMLVSKNAPNTGDADPNVKGPFIGTTDDQGQFELGSIDDPGGGVPAGAYTLTMTTAWLESATETSVAPPQKVPPPYSDGVDFEVPDGGTDAANFDLKSK
jgi:hypothetical protein